jgi:SNF2 family DNA or RNA helicase
MFDFKHVFQNLSDNQKNVALTLAATPEALTVNDIQLIIKEVDIDTLQQDLQLCVDNQILQTDECDKNKRFFANIYFRVWAFPLTRNYQAGKQKITNTQRSKSTTAYNHSTHEAIDEYLQAFVFGNGDVARAESIFNYHTELTGLLAPILVQPAYEMRPGNMLGKMATNFVKRLIYETTANLNSVQILELAEQKLTRLPNSEKLALQARISSIQGDFATADELASKAEHWVFAYNKAAQLFRVHKEEDALNWFEKGLKKQRKLYKHSFIPVIPEAALYYIVAITNQTQVAYTNTLLPTIHNKTKYYNNTHLLFKYMANYIINNTDSSFTLAPTANMGETDLWTLIAMGVTGQKITQPELLQYAEKLVCKAFDNGFFTAAHEAAYTLLQWTESGVVRNIYNSLSRRLNNRSAMARAKRWDDWELQLNSFLSLNAVQESINRDNNNGKSRIAYQLFPAKEIAVPVLQSKQADGHWTPGRKIALATFLGKKLDCMTELDRRVADTHNKNSHTYYRNTALGKHAICQLVGHPYVFLENGDTPVELVNAQPIVSVNATDKGFTMDCDLYDTRNEIQIVRDSVAKYKIYQINQQQKEIINAVNNSKRINVPEQGKSKLVEVLKLFSEYIQVQSDLDIGIDKHAKVFDPDSKIRVRLLPFGDGVKADLLAKPFGKYPPYCKPGKGGKMLMTNENGERMQVARNLKEENENFSKINTLIQHVAHTTANDGLLVFDKPIDALELLAVLRQHQDIAVTEWPEGERFKIRKNIAQGDLHVKITSGIDWFALDGDLVVDDETVITLQHLLQLVQLGKGRFLELDEGEFLALSQQFKLKLDEINGCTTKNNKQLVINRFAAAAMTDAFDDFEQIEVDNAWKQFQQKIQNAQHVDVELPDIKTTLRPYQVAGFQWMIRLAAWGAGACLADDMGLGKTVQTIAVLLHRANMGPALVVAPVSVMPNWVSELGKFAPHVKVVTINQEEHKERLITIEDININCVLVTSYGILLNEEKIVTAKHWSTVVLDEAHAIKNYQSKTAKAAAELKADFKIALTGTPLQNYLGELWNLFQFVNPGLLGSNNFFNENFVKSEDQQAKLRLKKMITPFILRRTKTAVLSELPPKTEIVKKIKLSEHEMAFYEALRRKAVQNISQDNDTPHKHLQALVEITRLRQACCNPALVEPKIGIESTKLNTFIDIAKELILSGHKALVFSQFVAHLQIVKNKLDEENINYQYLDGSTNVHNRKIAVDNFQNGTDPLFLISLKAGGLGLNLTTADYVIHLDPWWNPAIEDQASDRAHRMGQLKPVTVYRLVAEHTIEEKIIQLHNNKRELAESLLAGSDVAAKLSTDELIALIKDR